MNLEKIASELNFRLKAEGYTELYAVYGCSMDTHFHYRHAKNEEKEEKSDIEYMKRKFPQTKFTILPEPGHAGPALLKPELFAEMICGLE